MTPEELTLAAQMQFRTEDQIDTTVIMKYIIFTTPTRSWKYRKTKYLVPNLVLFR